MVVSTHEMQADLGLCKLKQACYYGHISAVTSFLPVWDLQVHITNLYYSPSLLVKMVHCLCPFVKRKVMELADFVPLSHRTRSPPSLTSLPLV